MKFQLKSCVWEITLACCFSCKYCGSVGGKKRDKELSTEECLQVVRQLSELGCERVSMIGGEVFMRSDWPIIVKALTDRGILVSIITNGYYFSDDLIEILKKVKIESIAVSLDGIEKVHDTYRQPGSFLRAERAIKILAENGIPVSVISTLNHENVQTLEEFYQYLSQMPINAWQIQACSPMGNAAKNGIDYRIDLKKVIDFVASHMYQAAFVMGIADNIGYYTKEEGSLRGNLSGQAKFIGCSAGLDSIGIDSIGNVRGCESMYDDLFIEGNLRERKLKDIWEDPDAFSYNRNFQIEMLTGQCARCKDKVYCAGGCRSYNFFVHHKMYEAPCCVQREVF